MVYLHKSLAAWGSSSFPRVFKQEVESLKAEQLPLQAGLTRSSYVGNSGFELIIQSSQDNPESIAVKAGIFYSGVIAGCNCADDPSPMDEQTEYCVIRADIDKHTAATEFHLVTE